MTPEHRTLLEELAAHGPSRALELCAAFVSLEGWTVGEYCDAISGLAREGLAEVRTIEGVPYWAITEAGRLVATDARAGELCRSGRA